MQDSQNNVQVKGILFTAVQTRKGRKVNEDAAFPPKQDDEKNITPIPC